MIQLIHNGTWDAITREDLALAIPCGCGGIIRLGFTEDSAECGGCGAAAKWEKPPELSIKASYEILYSSVLTEVQVRK